MTAGFYRNGHGNGAGRPHVELPKWVDAPVGFTAEAAMVALAGHPNLGRRAAAWASEVALEPYVDDAERFFLELMDGTMRDTGGGRASAGCVALGRSAAWMHMFGVVYADLATRKPFAFRGRDRGKDGQARAVEPNTALIAASAKCFEGMRQALLALHSLAALEARARASAPDADPLGIFVRDDADLQDPPAPRESSARDERPVSPDTDQKETSE